MFCGPQDAPLITITWTVLFPIAACFISLSVNKPWYAHAGIFERNENGSLVKQHIRGRIKESDICTKLEAGTETCSVNASSPRENTTCKYWVSLERTSFVNNYLALSVCTLRPLRCSLSHSILISRGQNFKPRRRYRNGYYPVTQMKQQLSLSRGWGGKSEGKTRLAECLSLCQVLLRPVHNKEMDWQVEKEDREASVIYCLQPRCSFQLPRQSVYQRKPTYITDKPKYITSAARYYTNTNDIICISLAR